MGSATGADARRPSEDLRAAATQRVIRVLVVDDHKAIRDGIRMFLAPISDIEWVGEAVDGLEATREVARTRPDVVLMDLVMPGVDGVSATSSITKDYPGVRVLLLTSSTDRYCVKAALAAGAVGFLTKDGDPQTVVQGIRSHFG